MGRTYAGILGPLAFATVLTRSLVDSSGPELTLKIAMVCLFAFAALGFIVGKVADSIVWEAVQLRFQERMRHHGEADQTKRA